MGLALEWSLPLLLLFLAGMLHTKLLVIEMESE